MQKLLSTSAQRLLQHHHVVVCGISTSTVLLRCNWRRPKKPTNPELRNLQGKELEEHLNKRALSIVEREKYLVAVRDVLERWRDEVQLKAEQEERRKKEERAKKRAEGVPAHVLAEQRAKSRGFIEEHNARQAARRAGMVVVQEEANKELLEEERVAAEAVRIANTALVQQLIEESANFITLDNLDEQLEALLTSEETNFNYAITRNGEKIMSTIPPGNLNGWKGANPSAYQGGFQYVTRNAGGNEELGAYLRRGGFFGGGGKKVARK